MLTNSIITFTQYWLFCGVKRQRRVVPVASEEMLDTQECGAAVSQGLQTGSQAVGPRGRAVSRGAHTGSQVLGRGRAVKLGLQYDAS